MNTDENTMVVLSDGYSIIYVPLRRYRHYRDQILIVVPAMVPGAPYKSEHLLGAEIWDTLDDGGRRVAGRCISHMERNGEIPLRRVSPRYKYPVQYAR
jgi:hypothetical protein